MDKIQVLGSPSIFFTLSAADLQWPDLHKHMPEEIPVPAGDDRAGRRQHTLALNNNPHIAAAYLDKRLQLFMKHFLIPLLGVAHFWYRYEWQEGGSGHIHGFLWLKDAPNADEIDWDVLKMPDTVIPPEQEEKMCNFTTFWGDIISATNPFPREDENTPLIGRHPSNLSREEASNMKEDLANLLNWVERHTKCMPGYCQVQRKVQGSPDPQIFCRFDFPLPCRHDAGVGLDSKSRVRFEPRRNDPLLNLHNPAMILAWRANIDLKPVLSKSACPLQRLMLLPSLATLLSTQQRPNRMHLNLQNFCLGLSIQ